MDDVKARELKDLIDAHHRSSIDALDPYLTHTQRMVLVLGDLVGRTASLNKALLGFAQTPSQELFDQIAVANIGVCTKIDELLEVYRDVSDDTQAIMRLVQSAMSIVKVAASD